MLGYKQQPGHMTAGSTPLSLYARHDESACPHLLVWAQVRFY